MALRYHAGAAAAIGNPFGAGARRVTVHRGTRNLLADLPDASGAEALETLLARPGVRVERIVSRGQVTAPGAWYDQDWDEWVLLLQGQARLLLEGEPAERALSAGDSVWLPRRCRHRVTWTQPDPPTVWLAIHLEQG